MPYKNVSPEDLFQCEKCGDCCKGYGGTFITQDDIEKIAHFIGSPVETFVSTYCCMSGGKPVLAQKADNYCIFWDGLCTIHPVKPKMCKAWPFIKSVIVDPNNWEIMSGACPGIRTDFPLNVVVACVKQQLSNSSQD
ncbi:MAG: YkgJ family cysteine cluster protein [Dissulfuribacterales bacterium]